MEMSNIRRIGPEMARYIADHQDMYPKAMAEPEVTFVKIMDDSRFCFGSFVLKELAAWVLCAQEDPTSPCQVYWYDLAVLPAFQRKGLAKQLMIHTYRELRWAGQWVRMHTRTTSYPRNELGLRRCGYKIVRDIYIPHHYLEEYGVGEDAHELLLAPV